MALYRLPILILLMSLIYLFILPEEPTNFKLFFKLIPTVMIIFHGIWLLPKNKSKAHYFILAGLIFSLIGDATIQWFVLGLIGFTIAHLCYMTGFLSVKKKAVKAPLSVIIAIVTYAIITMIILIQSLIGTGNENLILPIIGFIIIISLMVWSAVYTKNVFAISGSILFVVSNTILLWHLFVQTLYYIEPLMMLSFYGSQFLIATSLDDIVKGAKSIVW